MSYSYTTSLTANNNAFKETCLAIEKIEGIKKGDLITDVDGSTIQKYRVGTKEIVVQNDLEVDAVYVDADIDLNGIIKSVI